MWLFSVGGSVIFALSILMAPLAAEAQQATNSNHSAKSKYTLFGLTVSGM